MPYSSNLTDSEWKILEPLLYQILPIKKKTRPPNWTKREILDGIFYQLKNGCSWEDLPKDLPPYSTVYWYYKQWRKQGVIEELMKVLHSQVREQVKKNRSGPKIKFELSKKPSKQEKETQGQSGFVPVRARWIIERSNSWIERCKIFVKNFERTLENATAKVNVCFIRLMLKRLAA